MSGVEVINFGCRLNIAEGEAIRLATEGADDLIIINSCIVTHEAERQARQAIRKAAIRRPEAQIYVTGCGGTAAASRFSAMPEVSRIISNTQKALPKSYGLSRAVDKGPAVSGKDHARAFIEVQNGCDHRCTFCIIPFGRGDSRSIAAGPVIDAIKAAVDRGQQEVVLTGVDLTSYGADFPIRQTLGQLVERILHHVPSLPRLRLSSMDSIEVDPLLFDLIGSEPRIMPHVHLSLQAGDNMILKRMKRRHNRAQAIECVEKLKALRPDISIGADIIAGFPTETEAMFENSLCLLDDCMIDIAHIFPFSPRSGTPASRMPQLDRAIVKERAARLRIAAGQRKNAWLDSMIGSTQTVLVELDNRTGHAENFAPVSLETPLAQGNMRGTIRTVRITAREGAALQGVAV